jgi:pimeloyl-ACP methyl ester carboxylesterase
MGSATVLAALLTLTGCAATDQATTPAPGSTTGPALSASTADLDAALDCTPSAEGTEKEVVVLVPGTGVDPEVSYSWNWIPALDAADQPYCTIALPGDSVGDVQLSSEYVVHAIRQAHELSGSQVAVVGWSQGGVNARFALKYWPDTRSMVADYVGLASLNHGSSQNDTLYPDGNGPAFNLQLKTTSELIRALNDGDETYEGIDYTSLSSTVDQFVTPVGVADLDGPADSVSNIAMQDVCPESMTDHFGIGTTDPVAFALGMLAITQPGPADPTDIDPAVCGEEFMPGVDPLTVDADLTTLAGAATTAITGAEIVKNEPQLQAYVTD